MNKIKKILLIVFMIAIFGVPRLIGLGKFTSLDEPFWLRQSANFYYALGQREFEKTVYEYHPAVTTMWVITGGMLAYFPEYRALGQGYLKPGKFNEFMPEQGKDPLQLLIASRAVQVAVIVVLLLLVYFLLRRLVNDRSALLATALISFSPFLLGYSRLLNHEGMMSLFLLISLLGMLVYLYADRGPGFLFLSSTAGALGQLTKSSGLILFPVIMLAILISTIGSQNKKFWAGVFEAARIFGLWLIILIAAYILFWPGMWVAPGEMLYVVYGNALSYAFVGSGLLTSPTLTPSTFGLGNISAGLQRNLLDMLWHTTPVDWLGLIFAIWLAMAYQRSKTNQNYRFTVLYTSILAILFLLMFGAFRYFNPPHYILTSYVALDLIAGLGWTYGIDSVASRWPTLIKDWMTSLALVAVIIIQFVSASGFYPYYITYSNPIMKAWQSEAGNPIINGGGYGEGVEQAAAYLSQKAGAKNMTVMSIHGYGCFSYYFPGKTVTINYFTPSVIDAEFMETLRGSQYVVVDYYNQKRISDVTLLEGIEPEKIIWIDGLEYLHIYRAADLLARANTYQP